jgi:hypothetical protein
MKREDLALKLLTIIPCNVENVIDYLVESNRITLFTPETKYTLICYEKKIDLNESNGCKTFIRKDPETGQNIYKDKIKYNTDKEAIDAAIKMNCMDKTIHKNVAYKCSICGHWHIGRNSTVLTEDDKNKIRKKHMLK